VSPNLIDDEVSFLGRCDLQGFVENFPANLHERRHFRLDITDEDRIIDILEDFFSAKNSEMLVMVALLLC
jgi:hypothetical protein